MLFQLATFNYRPNGSGGRPLTESSSNEHVDRPGRASRDHRADLFARLTDNERLEYGRYSYRKLVTSSTSTPRYLRRSGNIQTGRRRIAVATVSTISMSLRNNCSAGACSVSGCSLS